MDNIPSVLEHTSITCYTISILGIGICIALDSILDCAPRSGHNSLGIRLSVYQGIPGTSICYNRVFYDLPISVGLENI